MTGRLEAVIARIVSGVHNSSDMIPRVLGDPRAYPREAMLLAVIAAVIVLTLVTLAMLVFDVIHAQNELQRSGSRVRRRTDGSRPLLALACLVVSGIVLAQMPTTPYASALCGSCHEMAAPVSSWRSGVHAGAGCYACHAGPSALGRVQAGAEEIGRWFGEPTRSTPDVDSRSCLRCHEEIAQRTLSGHVRVRHSDMIRAGVECVECHRDVGHASGEDPPASRRLSRNRMATCLLCHDGVSASASCDVCHSGRPADQASTPRRAVTAINVDCIGSCHREPERCTTCHGLEMPHPDDFTHDHARTSGKQPSVCTTCHDAADATLACTCHGDGPTHGSYSVWYAQHGTQASLAGPGGCRCHDNADFAMCLKCHDTRPW